MKPLVPAEVEINAHPVFLSGSTLSLMEKFSWLGTPPAVISLIKTVDEWMVRAQAGQMNAVADLSLHFGGLSGDYPHVHHDLIETVNFVKKRPMDIDRRETLIHYVRMGVRGLSVYVMARERHPSSFHHYNGPMNTLKHLSFAVQNGHAPKMGNGAAAHMLDEAISEELTPLLKRIVNRQAQDGYAHHYPYLLDVVGSICLADGQYTDAFQREAKEAFKDIFEAFDTQERDRLLHEMESLHFSDDMKNLIRGLADEVHEREAMAARLLTQGWGQREPALTADA